MVDERAYPTRPFLAVSAAVIRDGRVLIVRRGGTLGRGIYTLPGGVVESGETLSHLDSCGVRLLEGRHRTPMNIFVRDAMGGGCSVGVPPDNLGFRLVREPGFIEKLLGWFGRG